MRRHFKFSHSLLATTLAVVLGMPASSAFAVGLGKLTVFSGLGQPLNAEIELVAADKQELDTLNARVADPAAYRQANVEYQPVLTRVKVALAKRADGVPLLKITSVQPVNEPFIDMLLEVNWAAGRLVREYTFLLDPPEYASRAAAQALEPKTPQQPQVLPSAPVQAPPPAAEAPVSPSVAATSVPVAPPAVSEAAPTETKPVETKPVETKPVETKPAPTKEANSYGPVKRGDTLGKIAANVKPDGVTLEQMLTALYQANKGAFINKNMNLLRSGETLSVPSKDDATAITPSAAGKLVRVQTADWRAYLERVAAAAPASSEESQGASAGKITPLAEDKGKAVEPGKDQLRLSKGQGPGSPAGGTSKTAVAEDNAAREKALSEAKSRVSDLEKQVKDLQQLLTLKNQALNDMQQQAQKAKAPEPAAAAPKPEASKEVKVAQAPKAEAPKPEAQTVPPVAPAAAPATTPAPTAAEPPKPEAAPAATVPAPVAAKPEPKPVPKPEVKPKPVAPPPVQETSWFDDLTSNPWLLAGGGGVVALAGIWALLARNRKRATRGFEDSIMTGTDIKTNTVFGNTGGGVVNTGDNSLTTGFSRQGLGNIDTDEVDPIAEAEVYLAYGRDAQAEEILRDALQKDPQRHEIYLKLLEIQAHNGRQEAFATLAGELYTATRGQGETWAKAAAMGRQMDPANPMYAEGAGHAEAPAATPAKEEPVAAKAKPPVEETQVFTIPPALTPEAPKHEIANLDFNLDELTTRPGFEPEAPVEPTHAESMPKIDLMDWEPAAATPAKPEKQAPQPFAPSHADELVETLERPAPPSIEIPHAAPPAPAAPAFDAKPVVSGLDLDKLDLSFDPQRGPAEDPTPSVLDGQWHDAATKLDLAKAYHEMGDAEGAREILQEVLHEGDADQKKEAQTLLDRLRAA